jgi:hypothetical protein
MKKPLLLLTLLMCWMPFTNAQECELPEPFSGNTGSNMTVMMLSSFIQSLPISDSDAYIVAIAESGMIVGSTSVDGINQTSLSIWGDDTFTPESDGALDGESVILQLIDGEDLHSISPNETLSYTTNMVLMVNSATTNLIDCSIVPGCTFQWAENYNSTASEDDGSCYLNGCSNPTASNYNENVTIPNNSCLFSQEYTSSLEQLADSLQIIADTSTNLVSELEDQLVIAMANQDDGVNQADLDVVQSQLSLLEEQLAELAANSLDAQVLYFENQIDIENLSQYQAVVQAYGILSQAYQQCNPNVYGSIPVLLEEGWNTIGYNLLYETTPPQQFASIIDDLILVKSNGGSIYWPQFNFNGIGNLIPGQGYQLRMNNPENFMFVE